MKEKDFNIPLKLINLLSDGEFHSGEQFGEKFNMSRAGINKHIQTIRSWGVDILTLSGKGYRLHTPLQLLNEPKILLQSPAGRILVIPIINSTNQYMIEHIEKLKSGDVCVSEYQTKGRGRFGRNWISPFGSNLCLSIYWCLEQGPLAAMGLSLMVSVVIAEILNQQLKGSQQHHIRVKWPNDLYLNDRKLAGILVEIMGKIGESAHVVIGIGINLMMNKLSSIMINKEWINLQESNMTIDRNLLLTKIINTLRRELRYFEQEGFTPFISRWQKLDNFYNRPIKLFIGNKIIKGISRGINTHGALLLEQDGNINSYLGGEIFLHNLT